MPKSSKRVYDSDEDVVDDGVKSKKQKREPKELKSGVQTDENGNQYWELSGKRRVTVDDFKDTTMVNIREFYQKDGKTLPGKGISLPINQYTAFVDLLPDIERALKAKGIEVPRPQYDKKSAPKKAKDDEDEKDGVDEDEENGLDNASKQKTNLDKFKWKRNHEATSSSDEG